MTAQGHNPVPLAAARANSDGVGSSLHAVELVPIPAYARPPLKAPQLTRVRVPPDAAASSQARELAWVFLIASLLMAALGAAADVRLLMAGGAAAACVAGGLLVPQLVLALLVTVGGFKAAPWLQPVPGDATVIAAAGVVGVTALRSWRHPIPSFPAATVLALAMAAIVAASVLWSPVPDEGLSKAVRFEVLTLFAFFAPLVLVRSQSDFTFLMVGLLGFGMLIALTAEDTGDPLKPLTVVGGNDTNQIDLAIFCAVGLLAATYLALRAGRVLRLTSLGCAGVLLYTLFAAGSRGILAGSVLAVLYVMATLSGTVISRRRLIGVAGLLVAVVAVAVQQAPDAAARYNALLFTSDTSAVLGQRQYLFDKGVDLAIENPLGHGSASYPAVTGGLVYPHNIELELADEHGLITVAIFLALVVAAWRARRAAYRIGWKAESVVIGALIVVLFFDAQVSHGLNDSRPMWLALGCALALPRLKGTPPETLGSSAGRPPS